MRDYSILENLEEGVQIIDNDMRYVYLNSKLLSEVRIASAEIIGYKMEEKFPGIEQSEIYHNIRHCIVTGESSDVVNEFKFPDGRHTYYEIKIQAVEEGAILFSRDITNSRRGELLLQETNKQLEHFIHIAAHDMREPIRRISILSEELLLDYADSLPDRARNVCQQLQSQSSGLMRLINDLRTLSGIGKQPNKQPVQFEVIARECVEEVEQMVQTPLEVIFPEHKLELTCHPSLIKILLKNLLENAFKYGEKYVRLTVGTEHTVPLICIANKTSLAMPQQDIFLPFVKGQNTASTGIGLAICKKIVLLHHGKIWSEFHHNEFKICFTLDNPGNKH